MSEKTAHQSETGNNDKPVASILIRRLRHLGLLLLGPVVIATASGWLYLHGGRYVSTDNAYVKANILSISSNVTGMVTAVLPHDGDRVRRGDLLMQVDDQPYRIAVARAEANLANVRGDIESLKAEYVNKDLDIEKAKTDLAFREQELNRIASLVKTKSISSAQHDQAVYERDSAKRALAEKVQSLQVVKARLIDPDLHTDKHPRVKLALAELEKAQWDLDHVLVKAPADGVIVLSALPGENVISGAPVMNLIDDSRVWIEANFKETDLTYLRLGQSALVTIDTFPDVNIAGRVVTISPATGSEFSLLPAQNSSGNWVKVVQRLKVVIELDDYPADIHLAAGMSAEVQVDTEHQRSLPPLSDLVSL